MTPCPHDGYHSGEGRYARETAVLRYVVVCDDCREELREIASQTYRPQPDPHGNDQYRR